MEVLFIISNTLAILYFVRGFLNPICIEPGQFLGKSNKRGMLVMLPLFNSLMEQNMQEIAAAGAIGSRTSASVFKKYDIRGVVGDELIVDEIYHIVRCIAVYFKQCDQSLSTLVVGRDGRIHSPDIHKHVCAALQDSGINVLDIGVCPTPVFYYANNQLAVSGGIMITASHNPKQYNGLKLMLHNKNVFGEEIEVIKDLFFSGVVPERSVTRGFCQVCDILSPYIDFLVTQFASLKARPIRAVIDCAHGATAAVIPELVKRMKWDLVKILHGKIDGTFPAHEADPTKDEHNSDIRRLIQSFPEYFGIGFDGDGDRMAAVTQQGVLVRGDELTALFCRAIHRERGPFALAVDVKCSRVLLEEFKKRDITYTLTPCGVGFLRTVMREKACLFGGEISCHFCFNDRYFGYDDGIYAMLRLFEFIDTCGADLHTCYASLPERFCSPELRIACPHEQKWRIVDQVKDQIQRWPGGTLITVDGIRLELDRGCITMRASNTEPVLSVRFEGSTQKNLDDLKREFYMLLSSYIDRTYLVRVLNIKD